MVAPGNYSFGHWRHRRHRVSFLYFQQSIYVYHSLLTQIQYIAQSINLLNSNSFLVRKDLKPTYLLLVSVVGFGTASIWIILNPFAINVITVRKDFTCLFDLLPLSIMPIDHISNIGWEYSYFEVLSMV